MVLQSVQAVSRYVLYGESGAAVGADFIHVERIADRSSLYEWTIEPHMHAGIFQVLVLVSGTSLLVTDTQEIPLHPPCLVIVPCGSVHAFQFERSAEGWVLSVADSLLNDATISTAELRNLLLLSETSLVTLPDPAKVNLFDTLLETVATCGASDGQLAYFSVACFLAGLVKIAALSGSSQVASPDPRLQLVRRFTQSLEGQYRNHWSVAQYSKYLGTTRQTLTRACKYAVGRAPGELIHERMMREAMRALAFSVASVSEIADHLGFVDPAYFSRYFKIRMGMEPSRFRRERTIGMIRNR